MADQNNPNLKFKRLSDAQVIAEINTLAVDAQWDYDNARSPKMKREAEERLNLFGSTVEVLKGGSDGVSGD